MPELLTIAEALHAAAAAILSDDPDRAANENGVGYSKSDGSLGRAIAAVPPADWDAAFARTAWVTLRKYRRQLADRHGIDFASIPEPAAPSDDTADGDRGHVRALAAPKLAEAGARQVAADSTVDLVGGEYVVTLGRYDPSLVAAVKAIPGRRWNGKSNVIPAESALKVAEFADTYGIALTDTAADSIAVMVEAMDAGSVAEAVAAYKPTIKVSVDSEGFVVNLPYELNERRFTLKSQVGPRFDGEAKVWRAAVSSANAAKLLAWCDAQTDIEVTDDARAVMESEAVAAVAKFEASMALDADITVPGLKPGMEFRPFQKGGVKYADDVCQPGGKGAIIGDEMGLGKTPMGLGLVVCRQALPAVIVVPNAVAINWAREVPKFFDGYSTLIVEGTVRGDIPDGYDFYIVPDSIIGDRWEDAAALYPKALIADELHRFKNGNRQSYCPDCGKAKGVRSDSAKCPNCYNEIKDRVRYRWTVKRTNGLLQLRDAVVATVPEPTIAGLTGTLVTNRNIEVINPLYFVGWLDEFGGEWGFKLRYCGAERNDYGWTFKGSSNTDELNERLRMTCYLRRDKIDVIKDLPGRVHAPRYLEVSAKGRALYRSTEADVIGEIGQRAMAKVEAEIKADAEILADPEATDEVKATVLRKRGLASVEDFTVEGELLKVNWEARARAGAAEHLVSISLLKKVATEAKMESVCEWLDGFFEDDEGRKIVVFAENIDVVEGLAAHYGDRAVKYRGGMSKEAKQVSVDRFQEDPAVKLFVANLKSGSEGITLTAASDVAFVQFGWTPGIHDQGIDRCYGRLNDAHGAVGHYLLMAGTIEEDIFELVNEKRKVTDSVNSGRAGRSAAVEGDGEEVSMAGELAARLIRRAGLPGQETYEQGSLL